MSIVGWSLGGIYAREIARTSPEAVRTVVTLGSPFRAVPGYESHAAPLARLLGGGGSGPGTWPPGEDRPLPVPSTSVFSRTDGIVPWQACVNARSGPHETIEVVGSHCGLGHHPAVLFVVADRLAQPRGDWRRCRSRRRGARSSVITPWTPRPHRRDTAEHGRALPGDPTIQGGGRRSGLAGAQVDDHGDEGVSRLVDVDVVVAAQGVDLEQVDGLAAGESTRSAARRRRRSRRRPRRRCGRAGRCR